jgi:hypothetical protein
MFSFQQNQKTRGQNRFYREAGGWEGDVTQTMNTYVSKCKNDTIKKKKFSEELLKPRASVF